jgi:Protein of unknown function (DUF2927)
MPLSYGFRGKAAIIAVAALAGCDMPVVVDAPVATPVVAPGPPPIIATPPSAASEAVRVYYAQVQGRLVGQGLLRTDGGSADTPFDARMLADNFIRVALFDEYSNSPTGPVQRETPSRLRRWEGPVRVGLRFGASVPAATQATDRARVASYLTRLARLTGHPISLNDTNPNFIIEVVNEDERRALGPALAAALPGLSADE